MNAGNLKKLAEAMGMKNVFVVGDKSDYFIGDISGVPRAYGIEACADKLSELIKEFSHEA